MSKKVLGFTFLLQFVLLTIAHANSLMVTDNGDVIAEKERYLARFERAVLVYFHNKLTQETYTHDDVV